MNFATMTGSEIPATPVPTNAEVSCPGPLAESLTEQEEFILMAVNALRGLISRVGGQTLEPLEKQPHAPGLAFQAALNLNGVKAIAAYCKELGELLG